MSDASDPLGEDEILYRRILSDHYDPSIDDRPSPAAFRPGRHDTTGISFFREKYKTAEELARMAGRRPSYFVASFRCGDLQGAGIEVLPAPLPGQANQVAEPGHVELPELRYEMKVESSEKQVLLAERLCIEVLGPFPSGSQPQD